MNSLISRTRWLGPEPQARAWAWVDRAGSLARQDYTSVDVVKRVMEITQGQASDGGPWHPCGARRRRLKDADGPRHTPGPLVSSPRTRMSRTRTPLRAQRRRLLDADGPRHTLGALISSLRTRVSERSWKFRRHSVAPGIPGDRGASRRRWLLVWRRPLCRARLR